MYFLPNIHRRGTFLLLNKSGSHMIFLFFKIFEPPFICPYMLSYEILYRDESIQLAFFNYLGIFEMEINSVWEKRHKVFFLQHQSCGLFGFYYNLNCLFTFFHIKKIRVFNIQNLISLLICSFKVKPRFSKLSLKLVIY